MNHSAFELSHLAMEQSRPLNGWRARHEKEGAAK